MTIGERIKKIRLQTKMSQVDFADKLSVSKQTLYKYENNIITNIPSDKIEMIARIGGCSPAYLMGWEEASPSTIAAHKDGDNFTPEELQKIEEYKKLLIAARPKE